MEYKPFQSTAISENNLEMKNNLKKEIVELLKSNNLTVNYSAYVLRELAHELETLAGDVLI